MCNPASFLMNRQAKIWHSLKTDSHSEIAKEFGLTEDRRGIIDPKDTNFVKIEINPPNPPNGKPNFRAPLKDWVYVLDETRTPEWYDAKKFEKIARKQLKVWFEDRVIIDGTGQEIKGGRHVYVFGGEVTLRENSTATLWGNSTATLRENSTATLRENSTATLWGNSTATTQDFALAIKRSWGKTPIISGKFEKA